jgi:hypothetical protein
MILTRHHTHAPTTAPGERRDGLTVCQRREDVSNFSLLQDINRGSLDRRLRGGCGGAWWRSPRQEQAGIVISFLCMRQSEALSYSGRQDTVLLPLETRNGATHSMRDGSADGWGQSWQPPHCWGLFCPEYDRKITRDVQARRTCFVNAYACVGGCTGSQSVA